MSKAKLAVKGLKKIAKTKPGQSALAGTGAVAVLETIEDNPWVSAVEGAATGAAIGGSIGGHYGAVIGGVSGGITGYIMADQTTIMPTDMIAVPAFEWACVRQGMNPSFLIHIKEGEVVTQVMPTDAMVASAVTSSSTPAPKKKRKKLSKWNHFVKGFDYRPRRRNEEGKAYAQARLKAAARAWKKHKKGGE